MSAERRRVKFSGRVQGVGFRFTAVRIAENFPVKGYVQNQHDGRVLVVVQGESSALRRFLDAVRAGGPGTIEAVEEEVEEFVPDEFPDFSIRY